MMLFLYIDSIIVTSQILLVRYETFEPQLPSFLSTYIHKICSPGQSFEKDIRASFKKKIVLKIGIIN